MYGRFSGAASVQRLLTGRSVRSACAYRRSVRSVPAYRAQRPSSACLPGSASSGPLCPSRSRCASVRRAAAASEIRYLRAPGTCCRWIRQHPTRA